jgi:hypothetical protein
VEGPIARRRSATSAPAARGLARLSLRCGRRPAGFVQQPMSARPLTPPEARSARHRPF